MPQRYLLVDISNSFVKVAASNGDKIGKIQRVPTATLSSAMFRRWVAAFSPCGVVVSSVVPAKNKIFQPSNVPVRFLSHKADLGIGIDYPKPATIGQDRLANAIATTHLYPTPAIVVDFGTAVTFDVIGWQGVYLGGVIAPGLRMMTDLLHENTALLPRIRLSQPRRVVGKSTREAMMSGAVYGYAGLIRELLERIRKEQFSSRKTKPFVVATGGDAKFLASAFPLFDEVNPQLTLEGLRFSALRFFADR
jgi:type III pantothenate kinase